MKSSKCILIKLILNKNKRRNKTMRKMKQIKMLLILILFAVVTLVLNSCYPDYGLTTADYDIVATFKDDAANFQTYSTYFMPDTIEKVLDGGIISPNDGQYDAAILQEIANQMQAYGYTRINNLATADLELHVGTSSSTTFTYYPGYWGGYYGWYYPWYGYGGYSYSYTTGSLFITMVDRSKFDENNKIVGAVWAGTANGILDDTQANIKTRALNSIDKMFEQSPYLKIIE
jgi:predicted nucleic acid-binding Zn ribbon protein